MIQENEPMVWLTEIEPELYRKSMGHDPYAIYVQKLEKLKVTRTPARLLAYADLEYKTAHVIYLDGSRDVVFAEQILPRKDNTDERNAH